MYKQIGFVPYSMHLFPELIYGGENTMLIYLYTTNLYTCTICNNFGNKAVIEYWS